MAMRKMRIGVVGCGAISGIYLKNAGALFPMLEIAATADLAPERAAEAAKKVKDSGFGDPVACRSTEELLKRDDVELVLNLTIPAAHFEVAMQAVEAGKHVHNEKPLCLSRGEAETLLSAAGKRKLRVGCAPDTFLGAAHQTARKLLDEGAIGRPVAATAFMMCHGHESWHANPEFFYQKGGGPLFDMGPYYLTDLVQLLGPIRSIAAMTKISFPTRTITSKPYSGKVVSVEVPTHVAGTMEFACGAIGTAIMSFDVWGHHLPCLEVHGTEGSLAVPDPNRFGGDVLLRKAGAKDWVKVELTHGYTENSRGIGPADLAVGVRTGRPHRCSGALAAHVLEAMCGFHDAADQARTYSLKTACERPAALPTGLAPGQLDE